MDSKSDATEKQSQPDGPETSDNLAEGIERNKPPPLESITSQSITVSTDSIQALGASGASSRCTGQEETFAHTVVTCIRATGITCGLRRVPAGFYTIVHHSDLKWRTENKCSSVNDAVVEWSGPIPIPSDPSATVCLEVYASFESHPTLGTGEQLRKLTITVGQLLDRSENHIPFTLFPKDGDIVSPCPSILVTVKRWCNDNSDAPASVVLSPLSSITDARDQLEATTNRGHSALSRYRKHGGKRDLERSIVEFEQALSACPLNHPSHTAAQSNLATAKFIQCQVENTGAALEIPLSLNRSALAARPVGHADRPSTLIQLAAVHLARFEKQRDEVDRARAVALLHEAMVLSSTDSHENRVVSFMLQLCAVHPRGQSSVESHPESRLTDEDPLISSVQLVERFERYGDLADLQQAITLLQKVVGTVSIWDDGYRTGLANLGVALVYRFERLGELRDLQDAISTLRHAVDLTSHGHPHKPTILNTLGNSFVTRFEHLGESSDLEDAISTLRVAVDLTPHGHPHKPAMLSNLGNSFRTRFRRFGEQSDLEDAILALRKAVDLTPHGNHDKPAILNNLGNSFVTRFVHLGELRDIEDAISTLRVAVDLTPHGHPGKPGHLNTLGNSFRIRFERIGRLGDLEDAISTLRKAVDLTPHGHPNKPGILNNLGNSFVARFKHLGELSDLEDAISILRAAVDLTPYDHLDKPDYLSNLGNSLKVRFKHVGEMSDLEDAVSTLRVAVDLIPHGHPHKPGMLSNLGSSFRTRFEHLGEPSDLEDAISILSVAADIVPHGHPHKPAVLNTLGNSFVTRFKCLGRLSDLENAISTLRVAVDLTPHGDPHKPGCLHNLGISFTARFKRLREVSDLEDAISTLRAAVDLIPHGHSDKPAMLNTLGTSFVTRFECLEELSDLENAISTFRVAVDLTPRGHPQKPTMLNNLAYSFLTRFERLGEQNDLEAAMSLYSRAASVPIGPTDSRFHASQQWISCARLTNHRSLLHAHSVAINLLPQLAWIGLSLTHRFAELKQGAHVVREAAAAALDSGFPELAVEWLEQGRSVVWGELFQLRGFYEDLSSAHPDHACRLRELSATLEQAGATREKSLSTLSDSTDDAMHRATQTLQQEADTHRMLAIERDRLLYEIRRLPGFDQFLLQKDFSQLRASAHSGPVVILNAANHRCDALIVLSDVDHVIHIPLPDFTFQRSTDLKGILKGFLRHALVERVGKIERWDRRSWQSLLAPLWKCVVKPVMDALAFSMPGDLSRIFWCPTGPFAFLPIHAAGFYGTEHSVPGHKVFDFVVSSYTPTLSLLAPSRNIRAASNSDFCLLAVRQPPTDGQSRLPGVHTELEYIKEIIRDPASAPTTFLESSVGTVEEVLGLMTEADWVHFACHGIQDAASPADSGLCLANARRLKISDVIGVSRTRGGLAFLSACQTAMGDEELSDEAIHITAGMLFAGYRGVIGTMWSISDKLAPIVARDVYEYLFRNGTRPDYREAARALHEAIGHLRESGEASFDEWVPFIHVGL